MGAKKGAHFVWPQKKTEKDGSILTASLFFREEREKKRRRKGMGEREK